MGSRDTQVTVIVHRDSQMFDTQRNIYKNTFLQKNCYICTDVCVQQNRKCTLGKLNKCHLKKWTFKYSYKSQKEIALIYCPCGRNSGCTLSGCAFLFILTTMAQKGNYQSKFYCERTKVISLEMFPRDSPFFKKNNVIICEMNGWQILKHIYCK